MLLDTSSTYQQETDMSTRTPLFLAFVLCGGLAFAQGIAPTTASLVPQNLSYQGYLTNAAGTPVADGPYGITFALYQLPAGGSALWTEIHPTVPVSKGLFHVILGEGTPPVPLTLTFDRTYYLGIRIGTDTELSPRIPLTASAYSHRARVADGVADGSIIDASVAAGASIAASKLAPQVLTENEIIAGTGITVTNSGGTLTIDATGGGAVTLSGDVTGPTNNTVIANGAVTGPKIAGSAITADHIAPNILSSLNSINNDGGNINLVAGSNITIEPGMPGAKDIRISAAGGGGGLTLPYLNPVGQRTSGSGTPLFSVLQSGDGLAIRGEVQNSGNTMNAVEAITNATSPLADAVYAAALGGSGLRARNNSTTTATIDAMNNGDYEALYAANNSTHPTAYIRNSGTGNALNIGADGPGRIVSAIKNSGDGPALFAGMMAASTGQGLRIEQSGTGNGAYIVGTNAANAQALLSIDNNSADANSPGILVTANTGRAVYAHNTSASQPVIYAMNSSSGPGLVVNASSSANASIIASNSMSGSALAGQNIGADPTLYLKNNSAVTTHPLIAGYNSTTQVFILDRSGNIQTDGAVTSSKHFVAGTNLSGAPVDGGYYKDNAIVAWGNVSALGSLSDGFGVTSVSGNSGTYTINLSGSYSQIIPVATVVQSASPAQFITISSVSGNTFTVKVWQVGISGGNITYSNVNSQFFFIVTAR